MADTAHQPFTWEKFFRITINFATILGVVVAVTGWVKPLVGVVWIALGIGYVVWELSSHAKIFIRRATVLSLIVFISSGAVLGLIAWTIFRQFPSPESVQTTTKNSPPPDRKDLTVSQPSENHKNAVRQNGQNQREERGINLAGRKEPREHGKGSEPPLSATENIVSGGSDRQTNPPVIPANMQEKELATNTRVTEPDLHKRTVLRRLAEQYLLDNGKSEPPVEWMKGRLELLDTGWSYYNEDYGFNEIHNPARHIANEKVFAEHLHNIPILPIQIVYPNVQSDLAREIHKGLESAGWSDTTSKTSSQPLAGNHILLSLPIKLSDSQRTAARQLISELWKQGTPVGIKYVYGLAKPELALPETVKSSLPLSQESIDRALRTEQSQYVINNWQQGDERNDFVNEAFGPNATGMDDSQKFLIIYVTSLIGERYEHLSARETYMAAFGLDRIMGRGTAKNALDAARKELLDQDCIEYSDREGIRLTSRYRAKFLDAASFK